MSFTENKDLLRNQLTELFSSLSENILPDNETIHPDCRNQRIFEELLIGFGSCGDSLFKEYKSPGVIGPWYLAPDEWLPGAQTVLSFFFPFTECVRSSNRRESEHCSLEWAYGRIEGQSVQNLYMQKVRAFFEEQGINCCVPGLDSRFGTIHASTGKGITVDDSVPPGTFSSNWSERHAAFVCGLGTFGLSKGLITQKGIAGRFSSILIDAPLPADARPYKGIYEYCSGCGACVRRCPLHAIDSEKGKSHVLCAPYHDLSLALYAPRFGCGLCQTKVPCESCVPKNVL